ncbi:hypothetical protein LZ31DRAFT_600352 [Colletotrichum somersetense]|nr:hypothetical protein LZ31DRAFT_600352 [Colletotrichum somersetense]
MSALVVSADVDTLRFTLLEIARFLVRLCKVTSVWSTRMHHPNRFACTATSTSALVVKLENDIAGRDLSPVTPSSRVSLVVFVFTRQGSHYAGMSRELYGTSAAF